MNLIKKITLTLIFSLSLLVKAEETNGCNVVNQLKIFERLTDKERLTLLQTNNYNLRQILETLLTKFDSVNSDDKCYVAYLLGDYRFSQAVKVLGKNIALEDKIHPNQERGAEWFWDRYPAMEALIKIGSASISAIIQNLTESDDAKVRELSLKVIWHIDHDKDIVQLRLKKALKAEKDSTRQARLRAALKALSEIQ